MGVRWGLGLPTCLVQSRDNDRTCLLPPRSQSPPPMAPAQSPSTACRRETARCSRDAARGLRLSASSEPLRRWKPDAPRPAAPFDS
jgi:hypothetical protein